MTMPAKTDIPMPQNIASLALFRCPAPIFWATNTDKDWEKAEGTSITKAHIFSATPTPAEATTPKLFTIELIARKETPTKASCRATGKPKLKIRLIILL